MSRYLRFWGVRGSYPAPFESHLKVGGNTSCVEIRDGNHLIICDAGTGIIPLGNELMKQDEIREVTIILTHYHWDHISGLPFFVPAFVPGWKVNFYGPGKSQVEIKRHISEQMRAPYFPVETETWLAETEYLDAHTNSLTRGAINVEHFNVHHPGSTYGYRIEVGGKSIVYASDNELAFINKSIDERKEEFDQHERQLLEEMKEEQRLHSIEFMQGVDYLIHDAQYTPDDYERKRGWGHSCYVDTVNSAIDAKVKNLFLFHLDPNYDDNKIDELHHHSQEIANDRKARTGCHVSREGTRVDLDK
ncbi:MAG: hypothetical protein DRQ37_01365 [Gammaproteobacteria bacterium]|nr:MAG: hypothetical protein DRQ37_01365 [Gammaproteobacteria bacterium]